MTQNSFAKKKKLNNSVVMNYSSYCVMYNTGGSSAVAPLNFTVDLAEQGLTDGRDCSLLIRVRASYGSGFITLPWNMPIEHTCDRKSHS